MYKKINYITAVLVLLASISVNAQITAQSPFSRYGIGNVKSSLLPQYKAMGGAGTAVNKPTGYDYINMQNPASYAGINFTTIDAGVSGSITTIKKGSESASGFNGTLSHVAFAFPVTRRSALSFGLIPYSELGYNFTNKSTITGAPGSANPASQNVNNVYSGEGGLNKAYFGYGYQIGDHLRVGANAEYIFGNLIENRAVEFYEDASALASRIQNKNSIGGVAFSYGLQYDIRLDSKTTLNFGYSGSSASTINSTKTFLATKYLYDGVTGEDNSTVETIDSIASGKSKFKLPLVHNFGISLQKTNKWMIAADFRLGNWSQLAIDGVNQGLQNSWGASLGGQITPDISSINSYMKRVDYRFGLSYDKSYIRISDKDVKQMGLSFGLGLPLANSAQRTAFYKMNFTTEIGRRGTMEANTLQENYINLHLGFTINDQWFRRFKFQ